MDDNAHAWRVDVGEGSGGQGERVHGRSACAIHWRRGVCCLPGCRGMAGREIAPHLLLGMLRAHMILRDQRSRLHQCLCGRNIVSTLHLLDVRETSRLWHAHGDMFLGESIKSAHGTRVPHLLALGDSKENPRRDLGCTNRQKVTRRMTYSSF